MPKTLILLRHAKSARPGDGPDSQRPLAKRGRRDAVAAGRWLGERELVPQLALVSSALRTQETYRHIADELPDAPPADLRDDLYGASPGDLLDAVRSVAEDVTAVLVVAHNPTVAMVANLLDDGSGDVDDRARMRIGYPTSAAAAFEVGGAWADLNPGGGRLIAFAVPRG